MIIPRILKDFFSYKNDGPVDEALEQKCKSKSTEKDVHEPVISFVKTFLKNPRRFKLNKDVYATTYSYGSTHYTLTDTKSGIEYQMSEDSVIGRANRWSFYNIPFELTEQETKYLVDNVVQYYINREKRYKELVEKIARKRLYEVYK